MANVYDIGDVVRVAVVFTDIDTQQPVDPTTVTAKVKDPVGAITNYVVTSGQIVRDSLGNFSLKIEPALQGLWTYRFIGSGTNKGAEENVFTIRESAFD